MVVLTGAVVMTVDNANGKVENAGRHATDLARSIPTGIAAGAATGAVVGIIKSLTGAVVGILKSLTGGTVATKTVIAEAAAAGGAASAMFGAYVGGAHTAAIAGVTGAASAAAVTSASAGAAGIASSGKNDSIIDSVGWCLLGSKENPPNRETQSLGVYTYDCWKAVLHDDSPDPSSGKLLRDVISDPRIKQVTVTVNTDSDLPRLVLDNIWNEKFLIEYLYLNNTKLAAHAIKI